MAELPTNVILIIADSLCADALGCCGNQLAPTPNIDALADRGLRFETCYSTSARFMAPIRVRRWR
ncbi:sulfatase-like hydrolase/transferase [bacterium]|nr:sulfatase-like hydrolase/transferase [bacterium]